MWKFVLPKKADLISILPVLLLSILPVNSSAEESKDDLTPLSDEFSDSQTLSQWKQIFEVEKTGADQLEKLDISKTRSGWLTMIPYASTWYQDYRGVLLYKEVTGDFVVTTKVRSTQQKGDGAPRSIFSLAGIMIRAPRDITPKTWTPGGENYVFLSLGAAKDAGRFAFEVKTTLNSQSNLEITETPENEAMIRAARVGSSLILLRKTGAGPWMIHRRYNRPDMPSKLQVGMTVYTDYPSTTKLSPLQHNQTVIRDGRPDLVAAFDFFRFQRPTIPTAYQSITFSESSQISDADLLKILGN